MLPKPFVSSFIITLSLFTLFGCGKKPETPREVPAATTTQSAEKPTTVSGMKTFQAGSGAIEGKVVFSGTEITEQEILMDADPICAAAHEDVVMTKTLQVNDKGRVQNAFVYIKKGLEKYSFSVPSDKVTLNQLGCIYDPHVLGVQVNQSISILNSDSTLHNVHAMPEKSKAFNLGMPLKGMKIEKSFSAEEVMVKFKCDVHPWMSAYVGVLPHSFFQVTGSDGSFKLEGLPAGDYEIAVWHEKLGIKEIQVSLKDGEKQAVDFQFA